MLTPLMLLCIGTVLALVPVAILVRPISGERGGTPRTMGYY